MDELDILVIVEFIRMIIGYLFTIQIAYGFLILITGRLMYEFYAVAIYEQPSSLYQKSVNYFMAITIGSGYFLNKKLMKYSWIIRKILLLIALIIQGIISIIVYYILGGVIDIIFY